MKMHLRNACGWLLALLMAPLLRADEPVHVLEVGAVRVTVAPRRAGMSITWQGIEISKHSELVVTTPPWTPHFYVGPTVDAIKNAVREDTSDGTRLTIHHRGERDAFTATETISLHKDGRIEQVLDGEFHEAGEALLQWRIAAINAALLTGHVYAVEKADGTKNDGVVPIEPTGPDMNAATIAKGFRSITFSSRIGPVRIDVEGTAPLIIYDYRRSTWANPSDPYFWFGEHGARIQKDHPVHYRVVYQLPAAAASATPIVREVIVPVSKSRTVQSARTTEPPQIVPAPKEYVATQAYLEVPDANALIEAADTSGTHSLAAGALNELRRFWTLRPRTTSAPAALQAKLRFEEADADPTLPVEGYCLDVAPAGITIRARDAAGFLYAVQTLKQLTTVDGDGTIAVRCARVRDWPDLAFRGVHLFTGGHGASLHELLVRDVIAALKMNHLVLESEYIEWESHPEIHHAKYGMPKAEVRKLLDLARNLNIEVTPLVQALGHCQWMFTNDQNLELAEDPEAKWAYCVTNPKTYDFIFDIYAEALELFEPRYFHIGHDEFADRGRIPFRESSQGYTAEQLLMMDTERLHGWLSAHGVRTMLWGDMFLAKGEAPDACNASSKASAIELRSKLPKDVIVTDWHYASADSGELGKSLAAFERSGLQTIAATWNRPINIVNFAKAAHAEKALGLLQTTWAGYSLDEESYEREQDQYCLYVLATEAAWNASRPPDPARYHAGWKFQELTGRSTFRPVDRSGYTVDLEPAYNYALAAGDASGWFGLGAQHDLSSVPRGEQILRGMHVRFGEHSDKSVIAMNGLLTRDQQLPTELKLVFDPPLVGVRHVALVCATAFASRKGDRVALLNAVRPGGSSDPYEVLYGRDVFAYTDMAAAPAAPVIWTGTTSAGEEVALRLLLWEIPGDDPLAGVTIRSGNGAAPLLIAALTALQ
jgi:hypothetical protein